MTPLAHSARYGCPAQSYEEHISNVTRTAVAALSAALRHYALADQPSRRWAMRRLYLRTGRDASKAHDFGKLEKPNQDVLSGQRPGLGLPRRHEDAGVALLARHGALEAAGLVSAHHQGLVKYEIDPTSVSSRSGRSARLQASAFRLGDSEFRNETDQGLDTLLSLHERLLGAHRIKSDAGWSRFDGFGRRILLSSLVDADHGDTARHYRQLAPSTRPATRWRERLASLDRYVSSRPRPAAGANPEQHTRQALRDALYERCRQGPLQDGIHSCDAVVGSGKTTAVMAYLLRLAVEHRLRHVFVVLPYANIIRQSVRVYREALCLPEEDPEQVVAEHHHHVEFKDMALRGLTTLWQAPIIITTAVQFFETLAANHTGKLRKLHELPGSAVFVDEAHATMPTKLWPLAWHWLRQWIQRWNGHMVLASGSLPTFWTTHEFLGAARLKSVPTVHELALDIRPAASAAESQRIRFRTYSRPLSCEKLCEHVEASPGPRLVIVNTVQTAAILAKRMQERGTQDVLHLSTALAPVHRDTIVRRIEGRLADPSDRNWTLVATSLVEAGMDFSFGTGFRQRSSVASLIQTGGRVNRGASASGAAETWDFAFEDSTTFPDNPVLKSAQSALTALIECGWICKGDSIPDLAKVCLQAMKSEFGAKGQTEASTFVTWETAMDYPTVGREFTLISNESRTVLVDRDLAERIKLGGRVNANEVRRYSVQMYANKIRAFGLEAVIPAAGELFVLPEGWTYDAETFGYMAGWFERERYAISGAYLI